MNNKGYFYSYNFIFDMNISHHAKLIYAYLCRCSNSKAQSFPSRKNIGDNCSISLSSVKKGLSELIGLGLIERQEQFENNGRQTSNVYTIKKGEQENLFYGSNFIFHAEISCNAKLVYLYLLKCSSNNISFPGHKVIAEKCGIGVSTAKKALNELIEFSLLQKQEQYRNNGRRTSNKYIIINNSCYGDNTATMEIEPEADIKIKDNGLDNLNIQSQIEPLMIYLKMLIWSIIHQPAYGKNLLINYSQNKTSTIVKYKPP